MAYLLLFEMLTLVMQSGVTQNLCRHLLGNVNPGLLRGIFWLVLIAVSSGLSTNQIG